MSHDSGPLFRNLTEAARVRHGLGCASSSLARELEILEDHGRRDRWIHDVGLDGNGHGQLYGPEDET